MTTFVDLLQNQFFWRQLAVGLVVLIGLVALKLVYKKLKWTVLFILLGLIILGFYGQFFFYSYSTEGERTNAQQAQQGVWQGVRTFVTDWLGYNK